MRMIFKKKLYENMGPVARKQFGSETGDKTDYSKVQMICKKKL